MNTERDAHYWIAINGSSCAMSELPWKLPVTTPVAEVMFGFKTVEEALIAQDICLRSPIGEVKTNMGEWLKRSDVVCIRPRNPGKKTDGPTMWQEGMLL